MRAVSTPPRGAGPTFLGDYTQVDHKDVTYYFKSQSAASQTVKRAVAKHFSSVIKNRPRLLILKFHFSSCCYSRFASQLKTSNEFRTNTKRAQVATWSDKCCTDHVAEANNCHQFLSERRILKGQQCHLKKKDIRVANDVKAELSEALPFPWMNLSTLQ